MKNKISKSFIEEIHKINILDYMQDEYESNFILNRNNNWANTNCPMPNHEDNSPSFGINSESNMFHCFGCGVKGDIIKLVQLVEGMSFVEAIQKLANYANLEIDVANLDIKSIIKDLSNNVNSFFKQTPDKPFPGGLTEISFLITMAERTKAHLKKSNFNIDEIKWVESIYKQIDSFTAEDNYKSIDRIWKDFAKNSRERLQINNGKSES